MSGSFRYVAIVAATTTMLAGVQASAWDTKENKAVQWQSAYLQEGAANEHAHLADLHLDGLGATALTRTGAYGLSGGAPFVIIDLAASLPPRAHYGVDPFGDDENTKLEERILPPPAHFAGLPDWSYTLYDWINKNALCPVLPGGEFEVPLPVLLLGGGSSGSKCHAFKGWMGALNANHFGSQATTTYLHLHGLALTLAKRAEDLRLTLSPADRVTWRSFLLEAELEALVVEGYAQHFLQDRWSSGHQWERWGASDFASLESKSLIENLLVSSYTGLIHGAEAVLLSAGASPASATDPMCSPLVTDGEVTPVESREPDGTLVPTVGDYRLADMYASKFKGLPLDVLVQRTRMAACGKAGWAEVISALGEGDAGYGALEIPLDDVPPDPIVPSCFDQYMTNEAMDVGASGGVFDGLATTVLALASDLGLALLPGRTPRVVLAWRIFKETLLDKKGTSLAKGAIGRLGPSSQGAAFDEVADHLEPQALDSLPMEALEYTAGGQRPGRDMRTWYGFFNRSHTDFWCGQLAKTLPELRASHEEVDHESCTYLATRAYARTDPEYTGSQSEEAIVDGAPSNPICSYFGVGPSTDPELVPVHLHPGYVASPGVMAKHGFGLASIGAWCERVPVVDVDDDNVAATLIGSAGGTVTLTGHNFGSTGTITIGTTVYDSLQLTKWTDTAIQLTLEPDALPPGLLPITVTRTDGVDGFPDPGAQVGKASLDVTELVCAYEIGEADECPPGGIDIFTNEDIGKLDGKDCVGGSVIVYGSVTNIEGMHIPSRIDGALRLKETGVAGLLDLTGLVSVDRIEIQSNNQITGVYAPDLIVANKITLSGPALKTAEFPALRCVGEFMNIKAGTTLLSFPSLEQADYLLIDNSGAVIELDLHSLKKLGYEESSATIGTTLGTFDDMTGTLDLSGLVEVRHTLKVAATQISTLDLSKLVKAGGLEFSGMSGLTSVKAGALVQLGAPGQPGKLIITSNKSFPTAAAEALFAQVCSADGFYPIEGPQFVSIAFNPGCPLSLNEICLQSTCLPSCSCSHPQ